MKVIDLVIITLLLSLCYIKSQVMYLEINHPVIESFKKQVEKRYN